MRFPVFISDMSVLQTIPTQSDSLRVYRPGRPVGEWSPEFQALIRLKGGVSAARAVVGVVVVVVVWTSAGGHAGF